MRIGEMQNGDSGYIVPWSIRKIEEKYCLFKDQVINVAPGGTVTSKVEKIDDIIYMSNPDLKFYEPVYLPGVTHIYTQSVLKFDDNIHIEVQIR